MLDTFPIALFRPTSMRWSRTQVTNTGGRGANGIVRAVRTDGGGLWRCEMTVNLRRVASIKAARAILEGLDGGATAIYVPFYPKAEAPYPLAAPSEPVTHSDGATFGDSSLYRGNAIEAVLGIGAALRATEITPDVTAMAPLNGGEMFSIEHPAKGHRIYTITRIPEDGNTWRIRPPLREAAAAGTWLNFDSPKCAMRCVNAEEAMSAIIPPYFSDLTLEFEESMDDVA